VRRLQLCSLRHCCTAAALISGVDILSAELNFHVQHGRQAYLLPPLAAWTTAACSRRI